MKKYPKCSSYCIKKYWTKLWSQRFKCNTCWHVFHDKKKKVSNEVIYKEYLEWKQTYNQLAKKHKVCNRTIQRAIDKVKIKKRCKAKWNRINSRYYIFW